MAKQNSSGPELGVKIPTTPKGTNVEERAISVVTYTDVNIKGRCVPSNNNIMWAPQLLDIALAKVSGRLNDWLDSYLGLGWVIEKYIYILLVQLRFGLRRYRLVTISSSPSFSILPLQPQLIWCHFPYSRALSSSGKTEFGIIYFFKVVLYLGLKLRYAWTWP